MRQPATFPFWSAGYPPGFPGLSLWLDSSDLSTMRNNAGSVPSPADGIKLWSDKSGNSGVNCWASSGAASNTATSPNVSVTGSKTFSFDVIFPDYTPAGNLTLVDKLSGFNGFQIVLLTTGVLRFVCGNGTNTANVDSTTGLTITDYTRGQFQVIWTDGVGASFTQNGAALGSAVASARTLTNAAVAITLWTSTPGVVRSFTCGTYTFDPSGASKLATSFVAPTTGETWTINTSGDTGARISGERDVVQMTAASQPLMSVDSAGRLLTFDGTNDYLKAAAFSLAQPCTVYFVGSQVTWTVNDRIWCGDAVATTQLEQITSSPTVFLRSSSGTDSTSTWPLATNAVVSAVYNGASTFLRINRAALVGPSTNATNANGFTLGAQGTGVNPANITARAVLIYSQAHNQATQDAIIFYLGRTYGVSV